MSTAFNVDRFKAALTNGGARPNQFAVQLSFPTYVTGQALAVARAPFLVTVAELPGQTVGLTTTFYRGREVKLAGDRVFAPFSINVINDSDFSIRSAIEQWMNGMDDRISKVGRLVPSEYQRDMLVYQLDRNGKVLKEYKLLSAFPTALGAVPLNFGANDQISDFTVTFEYQTFTVSDNPLSTILNFPTTPFGTQ
ncbi:MAG: hypothetical protein EB127_06625 [Alphaproteobacteria bacterium]|nr:hypothetical protein [Alphaproteobacteria bacterium]